jgi:molybdate transport system ATP-binding protein
MQLSREFAIPILYVSHAMDEILNLASRLVIMHEGRVTAAGELEALLSRSDLQPYFGGSESGSVLSTVVDTPEDAFGLTHLRFGDKILKVGRIRAVKGEPVRVRIPSRYVAIALESPLRTSFQNIFPGEICEIVEYDSPFVDIRIDIGRSLWARITRHTFMELDLKPGRTVFALIKSVAISLGS